MRRGTTEIVNAETPIEKLRVWLQDKYDDETIDDVLALATAIVQEKVGIYD